MKEIGRVGLHLVELEAGLAENVESNSPELVDYEITRTHGQAMRIAMTVRGQDVIEDETLLKKIVISELQITPQEYRSAKRLLQDLDVLEERTILGRSVLVEKVQRLDHIAVALKKRTHGRTQNLVSATSLMTVILSKNRHVQPCRGRVYGLSRCALFK